MVIKLSREWHDKIELTHGARSYGGEGVSPPISISQLVEGSKLDPLEFGATME